MFFKQVFKIFTANRQRAFLTMLGIIIGVAAVIVVMSVGAGAQGLILNQITSVGSNLIGVMPGYSDEEGPPASVFGIEVTTLKREDALALKKIKGVEAAAAYVRGVETIQWGNQKIDATFVGVTADYPVVEGAQLIKGGFFDQADEGGLGRQVILGWRVWQDLFAGHDPLGERIRIKRQNFRVIGVMEKRGVQGFENKDLQVFIPLSTAQKILLGINHVNLLRIKVANEQDIPEVMEQVRDVLRERHYLRFGEPDDFSIRAARQALDVLGQITNALKLFLSGIAAISLLVGGVGIMNIMLVVINERTREIGLRKAIGATPAKIQNQFLQESAVLTILGGTIGILVGFLISGIIAVVAHILGYNWAFVITLPSILISLGVSGLVGILFGWYPARQAAKMEPVEALRYE